MKKSFRFLVSAFLLSASSALANTTNVNGVVYTYTVSDGKASIYKGDGDAAISILTSGALAIPATLGGYPVTSIGDYAFFACNMLTAVTIPENVTSIGAYAFYCCGELTSAPIPSGVTSIGDWAFSSCSKLTSVTIPVGVTSIGEHMFSDCNGLTSVTIPVGVTSISASAFSACGGLTNMSVSATNPNFSSIGGVLYDKEQTVLLLCPGGLTSVTIPASVTGIGEDAFFCCSGLTTVTIPASVTSIGEYAFSGCSGLTSVTIPPCVDSLSSTFPEAYQNITNVTFVGTAIGSSVCSGQSSLKTITIAESVTGIGEYAFFCCSGLTTVTIPASVTSIGDAAFSGCQSLESVSFAGKAPVFGNEVFLWASPVLNVQSGTAGWDEAGDGLSISVEDGGVAVAGVALSAAWLTRQGLVGEGADTAAMKAAAEQVCTNGLPAWKSFVAGLEPTNAASQFTTEITFTNDAPFVSWTPNLGEKREYTVWGMTNLTDAAWVTPTNSATRFYKVEVRLP